MPQGNVYVADMGNKRIQVFDNNGTFKTQFTNVGAPRAICISPGAQQFLYSSNSNPTEDPFLDGEIYKMQLDGTIVGRFGQAGKQMKEFGMVNAHRLPRAQHLVRRRADELARAEAHAEVAATSDIAVKGLEASPPGPRSFRTSAGVET